MFYLVHLHIFFLKAKMMHGVSLPNFNYFLFFMTGVNASEIVLGTVTPSSSTSHLVVGNINTVTVMLMVYGCDRDDE